MLDTNEIRKKRQLTTIQFVKCRQNEVQDDVMQNDLNFSVTKI